MEIEDIKFTSTPRENNNSNNKNIDDFILGRLLGEGAYSQVRLIKNKLNHKKYAVKIMDKQFLKKEKKVHYAQIERDVLSKINHPFVVHLYWSFQDASYLYMVIDLCERGSLSDVINQFKNENKAVPLNILKWYISEVISILEYLHCELDVIHRDVKPENILIHKDGHIRMCDFATCLLHQRTSSYRNRQYSFCGTASYASPEMLNDEPLGSGVDIWSLGCLIYQMYTGKTAFDGENEYLLFENIIDYTKTHNLTYPPDTPLELISLISQLLIENPHERLGSKNGGTYEDFAELKAHPFFKGIDFDNLQNKDPIYLPKLSDMPLETPTPSSPDLHDEVDKYTLEEIDSCRSSRISKIESEIAIDKSLDDTIVCRRFRSTDFLFDSVLDKDEKMMMTGLVVEKFFIFKRSRQLILTNKRLILLNPLEIKITLEIKFNKKHIYKKISDTSFSISDFPKYYYFERCEEPTVDEWIKKIEELNNNVNK